jgi:hypothetical protein
MIKNRNYLDQVSRAMIAALVLLAGIVVIAWAIKPTLPIQ